LVAARRQAPCWPPSGWAHRAQTKPVAVNGQLPAPPSEIARLLAPDPALWRKLLDRHRADASGHCGGCASTAVGASVWPCTLRMIAEAAQRLHDQYAAARGPRRC
ncbi:MAG: hypothetical protein ACR2GH_22015, partial [Pseudonocardia sp.]